MTPMHCEQVDDLLPWYAAGECDPEPRASIEQHLAHCPRCRQGYAEMERLSALLDWHHRASAGLHALQERLRQERRREEPRRVMLRFGRRFAGVAALFLLVLGLTTWMVPAREEIPNITVAFVSSTEHALPGFRAKALPAGQEALKVPQEMDLTLEVRNQGERPLYLDVGGEGTELRLELSGPGVRVTPGDAR